MLKTTRSKGAKSRSER